MNHQNRFNLIDEKWIPIVGSEKANLFDIFTDTSLRDFGGSPLQKIALQKLIQAIAQAAWTPENEDEWRKAGASGLSKYCLEYLNEK